MFAGQMGCEALNFFLKRLIKEERPKRVLPRPVYSQSRALELILAEMYGKGYGMPSSHAQFMAFFSIYFTLFLLLRHHPPMRNANRSSTASSSKFPLISARTQYVLVSIASLLQALLVAFSRIYLNYHTPRQVLAGCLAGATSALAWFLLTSVVRHVGLLDMSLDLKPCRLLRLRDLVVEEDLVQSGWKEWEQRRQTRNSLRERKQI